MRVMYAARVLAAFAIFMIGPSCQERLLAGDRKPPESYCNVPNVRAELARALCDGDSTTFSNTIGAMRKQAGSAREAVMVLEKVWTQDRTLGDGLQWSQLGVDEFRAHVVEHLSQSIRDGSSEVPLRSLQLFAVSYAHNRLPLGVTYGIALIGLTDAPGQLLFLKSLIEDRDQMVS